jgi:hypothetical protein
VFDRDGGKGWGRRMKALGSTFKTPAQTSAAIRRWMLAHSAEHTHGGELNLTELVEAWDRECSTGGATLDMDHEAWTIASSLLP